MERLQTPAAAGTVGAQDRKPVKWPRLVNTFCYGGAIVGSLVAAWLLLSMP